MAESENDFNLKFRYIVAYWVGGLQSPADGSLLLYSDTEQAKKVSLTDHTHEDLRHIDTVSTISYVALTALFNQQTWDLNGFTSHLSNINQDRIKRYGEKAAFLVAEVCHEESAKSVGQIGESDNREFCLAIKDGFKAGIEARHKPFFEQSQAFLAFAMPSVSGFESVGSCVVAGHPNGKPLYVLGSSGSARASVLYPVPANGLELYAKLFQQAAELDKFQTAFRLSAGSALNARDNLRSFVFAFTALESFLNKFFRQHKQQLLIKANLTTGVRDYIEEIEQNREKEGRTKDDYPVAYKFALVGSFLGLDNLDETMDEFDEAVRDRNAIAHGREFDEAALPIAKVRNWLGQLVRLHVSKQ